MIYGISAPDPVMKKTCTQFFCKLINRWGGCQSLVPLTVSNGFINIPYIVLVPCMLTSALDPTFNVKDALNCRILHEFGRTLCAVEMPSFSAVS
jgi:hypothetical protein